MLGLKNKWLFVVLTAMLLVFESFSPDSNAALAGPRQIEAAEPIAKDDKPAKQHRSRRHKRKHAAEVPLCSDHCTPSAWGAAALQHGAAKGAARGIRVSPQPSTLPKNTRQIKEGYWIGSLPTVDNIDALYRRDIRLIISATRLDQSFAPISARIKELGIKHIKLPFGGKFPKPSRFYSSAYKIAPEKIFIHCDHGGDRSGALLAYLLVKRHGWSIPHALLAVLYPGKNDIKGLKQVLESRGYAISDDEINRYLGIYSAELNGGGGGLKVRSNDYKKLLNTLLDTLLD